MQGDVMIQLEVQVVSHQREGLLVELGRVVHAHGYTVLRQRLTTGAGGEANLILALRGPAERQMALEEALATHPRVQSLETLLQEGSASGSAPSMLAPVSGRSTAPVQAPVATPAAPAAAADSGKVEAMLPQIAKDYPKIFPWLLELERGVSASARAASLHQAGRRTGAWVYKRDFALGAKLRLQDAVKRIAVPALRGLTTVEMQGDYLRLPGHPLARPGEPCGCGFFCGYLEGLLGASVADGTVFVRETFCRSSGADACTFEISH